MRQGKAGRLPLTDPAALLATWFGSGWLPWVPGTWGSLAALPFGYAIWAAAGPLGLAVGAAAAAAVGWWASESYVRRSGRKDPSEVVIDEVAGQWLTLLPAAGDPVAILAAFLIFRVLDIVKPFPANWCDRHLAGGLGVMLDDVVAGLYGAALLWLVLLAF